MLPITRRLVALGILIVFLLGFIIPNDWDWEFWVARLQIVPAAVGSWTGEHAALLIFGVLLLLTLIFGRVFCSWLCPLGIVQDIAHRLRHPSGRYTKIRAKYTPNHLIIRGIFLLLTLGTLAAGSNYVLSWLDPYSISARFGSAVLDPLAMMSYHALGYTEQLPNWSRYSPLLLSIIIIAMLVPLTMAILKGRLYCNTICPVGSFLGLLSRLAPCTPSIKDKSCIRCMTCPTHCKAHAIDIKNLRIDPTRCVSCYKCIGVCDSNAITLLPHHPFRAPIEPAPRPKKIKKKAPASSASSASPPSPAPAERSVEQTSPRNSSTSSSPDATRRALLGLGIAGAASTLLPSCRAHAEEEDSHYSTDLATVGNNHMRASIPPGAGSLNLFLDACTGCSLCITACPTQVLKPSLTTLGWEGINKPYLDYSDAACAYSCHNCADACPEGAIKELPLALKQRTQIGLASVDQTRCIVWQDHESCGKCVKACPTAALKDKDVTVPMIIPSACVACRECVKVCPAKTISIQEIDIEGKRQKIAVINYANCIGCGECVYTCPHNAIEGTDLVSPEMKGEHCIGCGACVTVCPARPVRAMSVSPRAKQLTLPPLQEKAAETPA